MKIPGISRNLCGTGYFYWCQLIQDRGRTEGRFAVPIQRNWTSSYSYFIDVMVSFVIEPNRYPETIVDCQIELIFP